MTKGGARWTLGPADDSKAVKIRVNTKWCSNNTKVKVDKDFLRGTKKTALARFADTKAWEVVE